jgi:hypothetical protein
MLSMDDFDPEYCSQCRYASEKQSNASEREYQHEHLTNINTDGDTNYIETGAFD